MGGTAKVECFSLFEPLRDTSTLPVGTWSSALDQSFRSHYNRLAAAAYLAISLLRPSGEKKQTFSVVSLQLTVQLPCLKVFSSFILPSRACQKRSFDDVSTVASGADGGVKTRQADRSPQSLRSTKIRACLPWPTARPETFCGVLATLVV